MNWNKNKYTHEEFMRMREDAMRQLSEMARRQPQGESPRPRPEKPAPAPAEAKPSPSPGDGDALLSTLSGLLGSLATPPAAAQEEPAARPLPSQAPERAENPPADGSPEKGRARPAGEPLPEVAGRAEAENPSASADDSALPEDAGLPSQDLSVSSGGPCLTASPFEEGCYQGPSAPKTPGVEELPDGKDGKNSADSAPPDAGEELPPPKAAPEALSADKILERFSDGIPRNPASFHPDQFVRAEDEEEFLPEMDFTKKK